MKHKHHIIPKHEGGTDDPGNILKEWREYIKINKILETKKLKKWRKEDYSKKLKSVYAGYIFVESIRDKIIPAL
jgi:hypothetical protein